MPEEEKNDSNNRRIDRTNRFCCLEFRDKIEMSEKKNDDKKM